jgi:F0F1-type ATP synthase membrane subunit b/b'
VEGKGDRFRPVRRRVETLRDQLSRHTAVTLDKAETQARMTLKRMIENTIDELEKMKRSLERESDRIWHAA